MDKAGHHTVEVMVAANSRLMQLSLTSKYFIRHFICGALGLPDPDPELHKCIALRATKRVARDV